MIPPNGLLGASASAFAIFVRAADGELSANMTLVGSFAIPPNGHLEAFGDAFAVVVPAAEEN